MGQPQMGMSGAFALHKQTSLGNDNKTCQYIYLFTLPSSVFGKDRRIRPCLGGVNPNCTSTSSLSDVRPCLCAGREGCVSCDRHCILKGHTYLRCKALLQLLTFDTCTSLDPLLPLLYRHN